MRLPLAPRHVMIPDRRLYRPAAPPARPALSTHPRGRGTFAATALAAAVLASACNSDASTTAPTPKTLSASASAYIDTALAFENEVFYFHSKVNFPAQQSAVRDSANRTGSQGPLQDTLYYGVLDYSIDPFFRNAGDEHSAYFRPSEAPGTDAPANDPRFQVSGLMLPAAAGVRAGTAVAYVWFPTYDGANDNGRADSTQTVIRTLDRNAPCGWILDLRFNPGGQPTAMMAGLNPLIGNTPVTGGQRGFGGFVDYTNQMAYLYTIGGHAGEYDPASQQFYEQVVASNPYTLQHPNSPVALLIGPATASAGEWLTLGFKGGPVPYRTFGEPTYGVTTVPYGYSFADNGFLNITAGIMMDRLGNLYGGKLTPDQSVVGPSYRTLLPTQAGTSPDVVVQAATAWLESQPSCGGTATASVSPSFSRDASGGIAPAPVTPWTNAGRLSRHWLTQVPRSLARRAPLHK